MCNHVLVTAEEGSAANARAAAAGLRWAVGVDLAAEEKRLVGESHAVHLGAILRDADVPGPPRQRCEAWQAEAARGRRHGFTQGGRNNSGHRPVVNSPNPAFAKYPQLGRERKGRRARRRDATPPGRHEHAALRARAAPPRRHAAAAPKRWCRHRHG
eukprot:scaffold94426_cov63-Phaeocystis_antarctica.AAC.3